MKKIMLIDDDKDFLRELHEVLEQGGYDVVSVDDSEKAVEIIKKDKPDVVMLDIKMPKKSGFDIASELKYFTEMLDIPIIAMSGYYKEDFNYLLSICGIKRCLKKPFNPLDAIAEIEECFKEPSDSHSS
ncbi:MAG: response regulator [Candidatus Omnitrophica bacterium]|nr:response regulator [Candidatus Omnitrophota bacterium]MDD5573596.1 response regulator [Candidatus Omnitrophota bacterium]